MSWVEFVKRWPLASLMALKISRRTVYAWHAGTKQPKGWQREAAEYWISAKAGAEVETTDESGAKLKK